MPHYRRIRIAAVVLGCFVPWASAGGGACPQARDGNVRLNALAQQLDGLRQLPLAEPLRASVAGLDTGANAAAPGVAEPWSMALDLARGHAGASPDSIATASLAERIAQDLQAVAAAEVDLSAAWRPVDAATAAEDTTVAEAADAETPVTPPEPTPEPPGKRELPAPEPTPDTTEANANIVGKMRELIKGLGDGADPLAQEGVTSAEVAQTADFETLGERQMAAPPVMPLPQPEAPPAAPQRKPYQGDPLEQPVNIDFREMDLNNVVALLAQKAGINVIAGTDISGGIVTANLRNVPLRQAMETALRMNGLGMVEEEGIYHIVPYEEAVSAQRTTQMITLENAKAEEVRKVVEEIIVGSPSQSLISISANQSANVIVIAGPESKIGELVDIVHQLDVAEPVLPTVTEPLKLNYADPKSLVPLVEKMLTPDIGNVAADDRARHLIVTDVPVAVEQVRELVRELDVPVKQVVIDTMVVDAILTDDADTGVDWLLESVRRQSTRDAIEGTGVAVGNLQELSLAAAAQINDAAGLLSFSLLSDDINWGGVIQAEIRNRNGHLISNPVLVTVENQPATITISQEIPYIELTQTEMGGQQTSTEFKDIGTVVSVTPRVTHDDHIIVELDGKESGTSGEFNGVPIEDKRSVLSTLRMRNGQTIFVGGLRKNDHDTTVRKIPLLGDIPVMNFMFRSNQRSETVNELMIFLTCTVLDDEQPQLDPYEQGKFDKAKNAGTEVNAQGELFYDMVHPGEMRDPVWKWRRSE